MKKVTIQTIFKNSVMMSKKSIYIILLSCISSFGIAQQTGTLDHYLVNQYFVNPAAAGMNGTSIFMDYRKQWSGFTGAPETQILAIDGNIKRESMGLGLMIVNDQVNVLGTTSVMATYGYRIKFGEQHHLRFGISAGLVQNRIIFSRVIAEDPSELQIFQNNQNASTFDGNAGLIYEYKNLQVGFSASQLLGGNFYYENNFQSNTLRFENIHHYMANAQYRFDIKKGKWGIMPSVIVRSTQGLAPLYEGGLTGYFKKFAWATFRYSNKVGMTASIGGIIAKNIVAGYAYSFNNNALGSYNQGSHDIVLGFRIGSGKKGGSSIDEKELEELNRKNNELYEKTDYLKSENEQLRKDLDAQKAAMKNSIYGLDSLKKIMEGDMDALQKLMKENEEKMKNYKGSGDNGTGNNGTGSNGNVKVNADGVEEMQDGKVYIVIGAVTKLENAKKYQQMIKREYNEDTQIVQDDNQFWYFIYTKAFNTKDEAISERDRADKIDVKQIYIGDAWYYISKKK
jgi:type IX secretion system PorP/SprF family membrane protein